jgi:hypothetical protein
VEIGGNKGNKAVHTPALVLPQHNIIQLYRLHALHHLDLLVTDVLRI